jgi:hypothetical protein
VLDIIAAIQSYFSFPERNYAWHLLFFGLGYAGCSLVISLAVIASVVKERLSQGGLVRWYAHVIIIFFGILSLSSLFAICSIIRATAQGHFNEPKTASISFLIGGITQALTLFLFKKKNENQPTFENDAQPIHQHGRRR